MRGFYYDQIKYVYSLFPKKNVLILISEENRSDTLKCYNKIFNFLGVKPLSMNTSLKDDAKHSTYYSEALDIRNKKLLYEIYKPHNEKLYELLGKKIEAWEEYYDKIRQA